MSNLFLLIISITFVFYTNAWDWNDDTTHPHMTRSAINLKSKLDDYLKDNLNLINGKDTVLEQMSIFEIIQNGAKLEDNPACRASNHFHDPLKPWNQSGLTDTWWPVDIWCYGLGFGQYPPEQISSNLTWATGFLSVDPALTDLLVVNFNEWDWDSAREYFHIYLTGTDYQGSIVAPDEIARKEYMSKNR